MAKTTQAIRDTILKKFPDSDLKPMSRQELSELRKIHPDIPGHLAEFFEIVGCGCIGSSRYMIYDLHEPTFIWGAETAANLEGVFLVGDDFAGTHEAYHVGRGWEFGYVSAGGTYTPHDSEANFVEFLERWYCKD